MKTEYWILTILSLWLGGTSLMRAQGEPPAVPQLRLGDRVRPLAYAAELTVNPEQSNFTGRITIDLTFADRTAFFWVNAHGLTVMHAQLDQRGAHIPARAVAGGEEFLGFDLQQPANTGKATLIVSYSGRVSDKEFSGLFRRNQEGRWYAATQMEATFARRVFPCFDEPAFKVPWKLALHVKRELAAVSNGPVVSETNESDGMKCARFAQTPPLPSYLVAFAVGPFDSVDLGKVGRNHTPVRIITPKGKTNETAFASRAIPELLRRLEDYYGLPYPYPKLDHLAVPQFEGAMENAGLIIHEESFLLCPPDRETIHFKRQCANVSTHEMAHQWFGDLVTMSWWDDIWLNESFATWISPKIVDTWQPQWRTGLDQLLGCFRAVTADSLVTARSIRQPIESETDIDNAFDGITYSKGAAVLKMFESELGPDAFRKAIQSYLKAHAWGSAKTADFLASLNAAAGHNVSASFSTFLDQSGVPLVSAELDGSVAESSSLKLSQRRYLPVGSPGDVHRQWGIPLRLRYLSGTDSAQLSLLLSNQTQTVRLKTGKTAVNWLLLNEQAAGYYVSAYHGELLGQLLQAGAGKLSPAERMSVAHSISAAVRSADLPLGEALTLEPALLVDPERRVVTMAAEFMDVREKVPADLRPNYQRYIRRNLDPLLRGASWQSQKNETDDQHLHRLALLSLAANAGEDSRLIDDAKRLANLWLENHTAVPPDEADVVLAIAGRYADAALFERLISEIRDTREATDRQRLISALGACKDLQLAKRLLDAVVARQFQPVDSLRLLQHLSGHIETRALAYDYLKEHYAAITAAVPSDSAFTFLPNLARGFDTAERRSDVEAFFKDKDAKLTGGPRIIAQVLESIRLNQAFKEAQLPSLIEFLKTQ